MRQAYYRIFERCGLEFRAVEADSGAIGGSFSHEFMVLAETGEDTLVICDACLYAANVEKAASSLRALKAKVSEQRERQLSTLNVVTAGAESYTRPDGVNVIALGHLFAGQ